jgi:hypothetical protein
MRTLALLALATAASAQTPSTIFFRTGPGGISIVPSLHADPPSSPLIRRFTPFLRSQTVPNLSVFYTRIVVDEALHTYFGYELLLERNKPGTFLATFGKLGVTPMDLAASLSARFPIHTEWTLVAIPAIPEPRLIQDGETLHTDLFLDPVTGHKLIDEILINPSVPFSRSASTQSTPQIPTVSGDPRDFSATDAELQILQPRAVILNGTPLGTPPLKNVRGNLVWVYVPKHGRYVMSLAPHPGLDFTKTGEVRGGAITFTIGGDSVKLESTLPIAFGDAPYNLWVLHDEHWEPTSEAQKDHPAIGSVGAAELAAIKRK